MPMKTIEGYSKEKYTNTSVLLAGGGAKALSDFIGSLSWDSTNKKIKYTPVGGSTTDLVTLSWDNIANKPTSLPANGGNADTSIQATNLTPENTAHYFRDPNNSSWRGGMIWGSTGSESMSFVVANSGTRFQFVGGSDIANWGSSTWQSVNPYLTIYSSGIVTPGSATASGFIKSGSSDSYVLLGGGGHKALSDFSMAHSHPYLSFSSIYPTNTINLNDYFSSSTMYKVYYDYSGSSKIQNGPYESDAGAVINFPTYSGTQVYFNYYDNIVKVRTHHNGHITNWATFITSENIGSQSVNYADSAGYADNANKLDNIDSTGFLAWTGMSASGGSSAPFQTSVDFFNNTANLNAGARMIYNYPGSEYTILYTRRSDDVGHGTILRWGYPDNYIRMIRMISGSPQTSDWEKISAGYADSAGDADKLDGYHANDFATAGHTHDGRYLRYEGWWSSGSEQNVDNANGMTFVYGDHGSPNGWGILCTFDYTYNSSYKFQLFAEGYNADGMYYRCRSSDRGGWTSWKRVIDNGNIGSQSVSYAASAGSVSWENITGKPFNWSGQSGQPSWLWGSNDGTNYYVWNPSNFSVNYANSAGSASSSTYARYLNCPDTRSSAPAPGDYTATSTGVSFDFKESSVTGLSGYSGVMTVRPYGSAQDWSGGEAHQIAFLAGGGLYHRIGTSSWGSWERILTSSNWSSYISIPSVGNGTVTITQAGSTIGSFTMNQSGNTLIALNDTNTNYYPIRSYTSGLQISSYSGSTDCALFVPYATNAIAGAVSTAAQSFAGQKTFLNGIKVGSTSSDQSTDNAKIYFGDGKYVWIGESPQDDALMLNCGTSKNIYFSFAGSTAVTSSNYSTYAKIYMSNSGAVYASSGFYESSDERLKKVVDTIKVNLDDLAKLRKIYYLWNNTPEDGRQLGMIAQDVQKLYPELVSMDKNTGYLSLAYDKLSVIALEAIDTLYEEYKQLKERINVLEKLLHSKEIL